MTALSSADQNRRPADPVRRSTRPKSPFALSSVSNMATAWSSVAQANQPLSIRARNKGDRPPLTVEATPSLARQSRTDHPRFVAQTGKLAAGFARFEAWRTHAGHIAAVRRAAADAGH